MSAARPPLSPSQPIWAEHWDDRDASGKCQRPIGLDGVAGAGTTTLDVQWSVVQSGCAWDGVVLEWALGPVSLGCQREGCDVLSMHHARGPDRLGEAGGTVPGWRNGGLVKVTQAESTSCPGVEQPQAPLCAGGCQAGKRLGRKGFGCAGGHQVEHKPSVCSCDEANGLWSCIASWVNREFFLSTQPWETTVEVVGSALGSQNKSRRAVKKDYKSNLM